MSELSHPLNRTLNTPSWYAAGDVWNLEQREWSAEKSLYFETIFRQANGCLGVRGYSEETSAGTESCREGYLAGIFAPTDDAALRQTKVRYDWPMVSMVSLPELFGASIRLDGEEFTLSDGVVNGFSRALNLRNGELVREVVWTTPAGRRTRLRFRRFLSAAVVHLALQEITIAPESWSGGIVVEFCLDGATPSHFASPAAGIFRESKHQPAFGNGGEPVATHPGYGALREPDFQGVRSARDF